MYLNNLKTYPINSLFVLNYYDKLLFTHPKRIKLIGLFITHVTLLVVLYIAPIIYDNVYFNVFDTPKVQEPFKKRYELYTN